MSKHLNISPTETLPVEFLSLRNVVYGGSGAGKTAFGRVIAEESHRTGIPFGVIDLKADWWGLKSTADGKGEGLPVIIFGGDHADVPIHEHGGAELADIVAELRQSFIIDLELFSKAKQLKFLAPFFDRLYDKNRHPLKLICDEADRYIPQRILTKDPNAAICLGAGEDIAKRGRKHGIFPMFIAQRNADLNKGVAELCDVAVIFRTGGPNDQSAVESWLEAKGSLINAPQRAEAMQKIAGLENGQAILCCAHPHLKLFKTVQMRMPSTFDSSATPEIGKELLQPKKFAPIELEKLSERMKATIEEAKANDPAELKKQVASANREISRLQKELSSKAVAAPPAAAKSDPADKTTIRAIKSELAKTLKALEEAMKFIVEITTRNFGETISKEEIEKAVLSATQAAMGQVEKKFDERKREVSQLKATAERTLERIKKLSAETVHVSLDVKHNEPFSVSPSTRPDGRAAPREPRAPSANGNGTLPQGEAAILRACIQFPEGVTRQQLTVLTQYKRSTRDTYIQRLREKQLVDIGANDCVVATEAGLASLPDAEPLPTGEALQQLWLQKLPEGERRIFELLLASYPEAITRDEITERTDYKRSTRDTYLQRMSAKLLFTEPRRGEVRASDNLFQ